MTRTTAYKGLVPIREANGKRSRAGARPSPNLGFEPAMKRKKGLIAHTCAIYVIESSGGGVVKIGTARNVAIRLESLQVGQAFNLHVFGACRAEERHIRKLEGAIHKAMAGTSHHAHGEWYRLTPMQAHDTIQAFAKKAGLVLSDDHQYPFGDLTKRAEPHSMVNNSVVSGSPRFQRIRNGDWLARMI